MSTAELVYSPYQYEIHEDPYPTYQRLRDEAPVYRNEAGGFWALSRHADVVEAFRDHVRFSSSHGVSLDPAASGPHAHRTMSFLAMDPPMHGRMRGLVSRGFTPRRVAELEPRIRELTRTHLAVALERGSFDLIGDLAGKLPMDVISELIGVPEADRDEVRRLSDLLVHREEGVDDVPPAGVEAAFSLITYYSDMLAQRRARRTDDLTSALLDAEIDGDRLTDDEIMGFLFLMVVAGNETTTKLLGNAWYWAWRNPAERAKPFADPGRVPDWIEETLRYDTSSQMLARLITEPTELHGVEIPAGERVVLLVGSANRDERAFTAPDAYDLDRAERELQQIASFGFGRHFCLGASLARLEARVCLEELVAAVADYDIDPAGIRRVHSVNVRGFATLPTTVVPR
ncbi:MAG: cytochrome P450 [Acidimicrobiales bacterium]|nr:cytochrome P450 [Acidimicrobiales bacterium]